jgi:hypothetical protein
MLVAVSLALPMIGAHAHAADGDAPSEAAVMRAMKVLESDPNLAIEEKRRIPSFFDDEPEQRRKREIGWLRDLFSWLAQTSRMLLWVLGAILATVLLVLLVRLLSSPGLRRARVLAAALPSHVRELDVRPESLPAQIGPAALSLWEQGEQHAALALLYRALVSRLIHVHAVPIRHSTTEAGCMELARSHLSAALAAYVAQLVRCWQRSVYGGMLPQEASFRALCGSFDETLAAPANLGKLTA